MMGLDSKAASAGWTIFLLGLCIFLAYTARHTLIIFALALFFAYMLTPVVNLVDSRIPSRVSRKISLAIVYVMFIAALVWAGIGIGSSLAEQAASLATQLPGLIKGSDPLASVPLPRWAAPMRERIVEGIRAQVATMNQEAFPLVKKAITELAARAGSILEFVLIPILGFFFLKDGAMIKDKVVEWTTQGNDSVILDEIFADVHILLLHYIRALVILSAATFAVYALFLQFTGGQYAMLLGGIAALLEFIPVVGPLTAAVIIIVVSGVTGYSSVLTLVIFLLAYRMFQDYVLAPYLMGAGVELHPLLVLFGVLAGEQIGGIPGMFFSVPVLAILRVVYLHLHRNRIRQASLVS